MPSLRELQKTYDLLSEKLHHLERDLAIQAIRDRLEQLVELDKSAGKPSVNRWKNATC